MGSIEKACISGFLCRLCSEMHRTVIHIYGDHGQRLCLVEKINGYLPITISPTDPLPKTICKTCLYRVEQHYTLLMRLTRMREERKLKLLGYKSQRDTDNFSISSVECSDDEETTSTRNKSTPDSATSSSSKSPSPTSIRNIRNINNLDTAGTSSGQILSNATGIPSTTENDAQEHYPTT
ncbi:uncharacterized protein LOC6570025 [Drosophila grimshawi]|uniref:uncharacterized protein LOC6570025 n=1 Tax=Drosophila grimshawi TaxID=7222 RepID=UPI0013EEEA8B|nr:uncharacterized protein LOC6570025 [Drosophila grimshawi]XP_032597658.1 uncharacterized protein LOC6570025 [Drosophila grimshawi]XP_032597659.1 uncharacterized protein LOC6570025 [Drosophila grimshawi]